MIDLHYMIGACWPWKIHSTRSQVKIPQQFQARNLRVTKPIESVKPANNKMEEERKPKVSFPEAVAKIDPSDLAANLVDISKLHGFQPEVQLLKFVEYLGITLSDVQFPWVNMFNDSPFPKLIHLIHVPLSQIPHPVYKTSVDWINRFRITTLAAFVMWASKHILTCLEEAKQQADHPKGAGGEIDAAQQPPPKSKSKVAIFVALAMVLRKKPKALAIVLPAMRVRRKYLGQDKLPFIVWMMAQASRYSLAVGLFSWVRNLLPLVDTYSPQSTDLIMQLVEKILSNPKARALLVNGSVAKRSPRVIPPPSFEILLRLTFPVSSARVEATERFEAIYPLLKDVALAGIRGSELMKQVTEEMFTLSLKLAGEEGNPPLAKEATTIAIWSLTENVDCFKLWERLYYTNKEASGALLKRLVGEWKDHYPKLSSSPGDKLTLNRTMLNFMLMNEKAITEGGGGGANCSLYKEAHKSCIVISERLSRGSGCLKGVVIAAVVLVAAVLLSFNLEATSVLQKLVVLNAIIKTLTN
ncbi:PREDICTED: uncharacterized protein LOC104714538 [Camelina sativa]|uniref:Uncharacterized protein LOC104714538 n=1 Tax=Camelina sativa TaxID=90675 RepID=A0ABM0TRP2_CAMSA|nr:PREDICTED: uncharacterized protein LOC104714538 [Camelina sativa]